MTYIEMDALEAELKELAGSYSETDRRHRVFTQALAAIQYLRQRVAGTILVSEPNYPRPTGPVQGTAVDASHWPRMTRIVPYSETGSLGGATGYDQDWMSP